MVEPSAPVKDERTALLRVGSFIQTSCVILVVTAILFLAINFALAPFVPPAPPLGPKQPSLAWSPEAAHKWVDHYGIDVLRRVYPGKTDAELEQIINRKFAVGFRYETFLEFNHDPALISDPKSGKYIGFHEVGFRFGGKDQGPWPIDRSKLNVFVFGGSTAMGGTGASDDETLPAYLQKLLRERLGKEVYVYNFAVGAYYSSQELINFWRLARSGFFPDLVVFVDGLNDYYQKTEDTAHSGYFRDMEQSRVALLSQLQLDRGSSWHLEKALELSPALRAMSWLKRREPQITADAADTASAKRTIVRKFNDEDFAHVRHATDRMLNNFRLSAGMAAAIQAESVLVIQPTPMYAYDLDRHPFPVEPWHQYTRIGYPILKERLAAETAGENIVWCADLAEHAPANVPLYVDSVHYTPLMNELVATCITDQIERDGILGRLAARTKPQK